MGNDLNLPGRSDLAPKEPKSINQRGKRRHYRRARRNSRAHNTKSTHTLDLRAIQPTSEIINTRMESSLVQHLHKELYLRRQNTQ
jgi:hypothetical protein